MVEWGMEKSNEWYTPGKYVEAARQVMGGIDLDPASCEVANRTVKAGRYYSREENGLMLPWYGRVWCNPPYGRVNNLLGGGATYQSLFARRGVSLFRSGQIEQIIFLLHGSSCFLPWYQTLFDVSLECKLRGNLHFFRPDGKKEKNGFGTVFVYLGSCESRFIDIFSQFGSVFRSVSPPRESTLALELWDASVM